MVERNAIGAWNSTGSYGPGNVTLIYSMEQYLRLKACREQAWLFDDPGIGWGRYGPLAKKAVQYAGGVYETFAFRTTSEIKAFALTALSSVADYPAERATEDARDIAKAVGKKSVQDRIQRRASLLATSDIVSVAIMAWYRARREYKPDVGGWGKYLRTCLRNAISKELAHSRNAPAGVYFSTLLADGGDVEGLAEKIAHPRERQALEIVEEADTIKHALAICTPLQRVALDRLISRRYDTDPDNESEALSKAEHARVGRTRRKLEKKFGEGNDGA